MKDFIIRCIEQHRGDDYYRAITAFMGRTAKQLQEPYGQSGQTCQTILDGYKQRGDKCDKAIAAIKKCDKLD